MNKANARANVAGHFAFRRDTAIEFVIEPGYNDRNPMLTFSERVVKIALGIPKGKVTTYGDIARTAGAGPMAAQSITSILDAAAKRGVKDIPFHRIVYADGRIWVSDRRRKERLALYKKEGIRIDEKDRIMNFADVRMSF